MTLGFDEAVYELCKRIPVGRVSTYRDVAHALGCRAYRAVGSALKKNPHAQVPCHRVISSDGSLGGFKGRREGREMELKASMLEREGVDVVDGRVDLKKFGYKITDWDDRSR